MNDDLNLKEEENLKAENQFLKLKLMLEQGAEFGSMQDANLPADIQNQFLKNIIEFEKQFEERKRIKVFDKIGKPNHFKPVNEIPDDKIENAWSELDKYLNKYHIDLAVCSPNISARELYRFTIEELFNYEMDDMNLQGMTSCFTYDEFHPDHIYDNSRAAVDDCIRPMLEKELFEWMHHFRKNDLQLNEYFPLNEEDFKQKVDRYKEAYENIAIQEIIETGCKIVKTICKVQGSYKIEAKLENDNIVLQGNWIVQFQLDESFGYWYIINVQIEGINF